MPNDATPHAPLTKRATITASSAEVWRAWTDQAELATWFGRDARVELRVGGPYEILFLMDNPPGLQGGEGNIVQSFTPEQSIDFTWNAPPDFGPLRDVRTHVHIEIIESGSETIVTLTHDHWGGGPDWAPIRTYFDRAWDHVMSALAAHLSKS